MIPAQNRAIRSRFAACAQHCQPAPGHGAFVSTGGGGRSVRHLPLYLHRSGTRPGHRVHPRRQITSPARPHRRAKPPHHRRFQNLAGVPGQGEEPPLGVAHPAHSFAGQSQVVAGIWEVLSELKQFSYTLGKFPLVCGHGIVWVVFSLWFWPLF